MRCNAQQSTALQCNLLTCSAPHDTAHHLAGQVIAHKVSYFLPRHFMGLDQDLAFILLTNIFLGGRLSEIHSIIVLQLQGDGPKMY